MRLILALSLMFLSASGSLAASNSSAKRSVDWYDLLESFAIPASASWTLPGWDTNAAAASPVRWITQGLEVTQDRYVRKGKVVVSVGGKPIQVLDRVLVNHAWDIVLAGPRAGIDEVELSSNLNSQSLDLDVGEDLRRRRVPFSLLKCGKHNGASSGSALYSINPAKKKSFWLAYQWSCGSAGCSADLAMFYAAPDPKDLREPMAKCESEIPAQPGT